MVRLRHQNGSGSLYDQCEADAATFLSKHSELKAESEAFEARIEDSIVSNSLIYKAHIHRSIVSNSLITGACQIFNSSIDCETIVGTPSIDYSMLSGKTRIWGNPLIYNVSIKDLSVFGDACLIGEWSMEGKLGRIGLGVWTRPPRVVRYDDLQITITESVPGYAYIGCRLHPLSWWFKIGDKIGKAAGWTAYQVQRTRELFQVWSLESGVRTMISMN